MVQGIGEVMGAMFIGLFVAGILLASLVGGLVLAVLKWIGVLAISWWWVVGIFPAIITIALIIWALVAGFARIFG